MLLRAAQLLVLAALLVCSSAWLDAARAEDLATIVATRAPRRRIIFFLFNVRDGLSGGDLSWLRFARSLHWQLSHVHGDEFVALGATAADCEKLERPHCVLNSFLPANWSRHQDMETHWGARYSFLSRLLASGLDVFMMDSDFAVHRNVWHWLDASPCAARASCGFFAEGGGPNGGTAWVRAAAHTGNNSRACTWLLAQPARRYVLFLEAAGGGFGPPGNLADQNSLKAGVEIAAHPEVSDWDFGMQYREGNRAHPFWAAHPQRDTPRVLDVAEDCRDHSEPGVTHTVQLSRLYAIGHAPTDPPEYLMWLPPNYIQDSTNDWPGTWTVTHLIRTKGTFRASRALADESSKVARLAYLQLYGLLDPGERLLPPGARLLFVDERLVARVASHWPQLRNVVREALWEAAAFGRLLVLPRLPCDAPWSKGLHRRDDERLLWDRRPGAGGGAGDAAFRCYAGVHIHTSCWPGERVAMAFDPEVVARRPGARRGGDLAQPGDVVVSHFSKAHELRPGGTADQTAVVPPGDGRAGLLQECGMYFEVEEGSKAAVAPYW